MFVRLVTFALPPDRESVAADLARDLGPEIRQQPGCQAVTFFGDSQSGQYHVYVLWNSQAEADAGARVIRPKLDQHLSGNGLRPPDTQLFAVIEFA